MNIIKTVDDEVKEVTTSGNEIVMKIYKKSLKYLQRLTMSFWVMALITGNLMCIQSAIRAIFFENEFAPMILPSWFPWNDYPTGFWLIYLVQYFAMNIGMLIVPCWHSFIVSIMVFVIMKLRILNHKLSEIDKSTTALLSECLTEREKLLSFVNELSSLESSSLFLDFLVFSVLLCALLFQASQV